ncbi:MAG: lytic transglycosylase domain-containing protein [Clostridium argentinense]|uniref:Lytic transglycosylase domain-containing protein n=2 Tax=Clostridiaceae TaxID=31979 RepID=A0ABR8YTQ9_9CLOT|nr:lytic transglycosylase domain-containing protein [Clostridium faecium]MBS5823838.1 lytic transglycosylase domain-containing protein [Clostridium argentinense]
MKEKDEARKINGQAALGGENDLTHITDLMLRNNYGLDGIINRATNSNNYHGISNGYVSATAPVSNDVRIEKAIKEASVKHNVNEGLIRAIIKVESDFNPNTVSWAGAMGLMQLMPENVSHYGVNDPFNIEENIDAGTRHIKDYLNMFNGDLEMALAAYNCGPGTMEWRGVKTHADFNKLPEETQNYLVKIKQYYNP